VAERAVVDELAIVLERHPPPAPAAEVPAPLPAAVPVHADPLPADAP
jgi:hypothetical protein